MDWNTSDLEGKIICEIAWRVGAAGVRAIKPHAVKAYSCTRPAICVKASAAYHQLGWFGWTWFLATVGSLGIIAVWNVRGLEPPIYACLLPTLALFLLLWDAGKAGLRRIWAATAGVKK